MEIHDTLCVLDAASGIGQAECLTILSTGYPAGDIAPCAENFGPDEVVEIEDTLAVLDAAAGEPPCADCDCHPCEVGRVADAGTLKGCGDQEATEGVARNGQALLIFLTTRKPVNGERYAVVAGTVIDWLVKHMTVAQREALVADLRDPSLEFKSEVGARLAETAVTRLLAGTPGNRD